VRRGTTAGARRPATRGSGGVRALGGLAAVAMLAVGLTGCGPVEIETHDLDAADREACEAFVADLPDVLADEDRVEVSPDDALGAAYGDPAITVTCGVPAPEGFDLTAQCQLVSGVGWYVPPEQFDDPDTDAVVSAAGNEPVVQVVVPGGDDRGDVAAAVMAELAPLVKAHLPQQVRCD
jgi:hypothetical protein